MAVFDKQVTAKKTVTYKDMVAAGVIKVVEENALKPVVGDANLVSAAVKLGAGYACKEYGTSASPFLGNAAALAFTIDGVEDAIISVANQTGILSTVIGTASGAAGALTGSSNNRPSWAA